MGALWTSIRWDWFKLARRRMPWILLAILLLMSQLILWGNFAAYHELEQTSGTIPVPLGPGVRPEAVSCRDILAGNVAGVPPNISPELLPVLQSECRQEQAQVDQQLAQSYRALSLPGSIPDVLNLAVAVELILFAILTSSHIGAEFGWGTVRPNLSRGVGRWQFVGSRLLLLALLAAAALLVVVGVTAVSSTIATSIAAPPPQGGSPGMWGDALSALAKGWVALIPYIALAGFFTLLARSTAAGMAIAIGYYLAEQIVVAIFGALFGWFATVARYLLAQNIGAWAGLSFFARSQISVSSLHAFLVLLVYTAVFVAAALYLFEVRDISGASGG